MAMEDGSVLSISKISETIITFSDIFKSCPEELPHFSTIKNNMNTTTVELIKQQLKNLFVGLDNDISETALNVVEQVSMLGNTIYD